MNKRDAQANTDLKERILASRTQTGETVAEALDYASRHIPFAVLGWRFVYARSGAEYVILKYGSRASPKGSADDLKQAQSFFDYDLETDPVFSLRNSRANGSIVWKVEGKAFLPWGSYANMLALGPQAFVWAINDGRGGFADSGYDEAVARDFSFFSKLQAGPGKLSELVSPSSASKLTVYWNVVDGYVAEADNLACPPKAVGAFTVRGPNCEARAAAERDIPGKVLPFKVIRAIRNHAFVRGMVEADVSISVEGGEPGDWMATGVYVAEHAVTADVTFASVSVFVPNPWADFPAQQSKLLAKVYYGPDPARSPWEEKWTVIGARRAGSLADAEFDKLSNDLIEDPARIPDPETRLRRASDAARRVVIKKYGLPEKWKSADDLGLDGQEHDRDHIQLGGPREGDNSLTALTDCLTTSKGTAFIEGCTPDRQ